MRYLGIVALAVALCLALVPGYPSLAYAYEDTQCFQCHTSAKQLIDITREIAKTRPAVKSEDIEGEG